jgi:HEAT repeat protein
MSPRLKLIVFVAVLALFLWPVLMREPLHKGKPVGYWVDRACEGGDLIESWEFRREVKNIGPSAVPRLVKRLRPWDTWRNAYRSFRACLPSRLQGLCPDVLSVAAIAEQRYGAATTLAMFGADAKPAVGTPVRLLPRLKPQVQGAVILTLTTIGPDARKALPVLHSLLPNQAALPRLQIAEALWRIGRETNKVLEICTNALASSNKAASAQAGFVLSRLLTAAAPAVPCALKVFQDTNRSVSARMNAAQVLGAARVSNPEITSSLLEGTKADQDLHLRSNCALALWRLDSQYAPLATRIVIEDLVSSRKDAPSRQDLVFTKWLEFRSLDHPQESIPTLQRLLESDSPDIRKEADFALQGVEAKTKTAAGHIEGVR